MVAEKDCDRHGKNDKLDVREGQRKSVFGKFADSEMLHWIKGLALDPCKAGVSRNSIRPLWNQTLKVRKAFALSDAEFPRRKRKLRQFLKNKFGVVHGSTSSTYNQQNVTKLNRTQLSHASSASCLLNPVDTPETLNPKPTLNSYASGSLLTCEDTFPDKQLPSEFSSLDNATKWDSPNKDLSLLINSDESVNGSNPSSPENQPLQDPTSLWFDDSVHSSNACSSEVLRQNRLQTPRRSIRLLNFIGDSLHRTVIPIGPRFQAYVPVWTSPTNKIVLDGNYPDCESSRWLGTRTWPMNDEITETTTESVVGKGRDDSCSCVSPTSKACIKRHVLEEKLVLQSDLGHVFLVWKFDEMGEEISKLWTLKEQERFASLVKTYPLSNGKKFMRYALKCFPSKCKESILSYYFNVSIPRHISTQTRSSPQEINSDSDEAKEDIHHKGGSNRMWNVTDAKSQYLHPRS